MRRRIAPLAILLLAGLTVAGCASAEEAQQRLADEDFVALVTDLNLGSGMNGLQLCEWVGCDLMGFSKSPISAVTTAILLGLILNNLLPLPRFLRPGLTFAVKKVLRLGIMMLGIRLSFVDALQVGLTGVPIVVGCILGALAITALIGRWLKLPGRLATLIAVGVAPRGNPTTVQTLTLVIRSI